MGKTHKITKEFLLTDDSVNVYGFRLLTSGYKLDKYKANPIGYRQHKRDDGVVLKWEDFRTDGDKLFAKPVINLANPLGQQTADEVENGFLNAASIGGIVVLEFSDAPELMLPGQTGPTVTSWYNKETSLVDVPGNPNAMVQLYDEQDNEINLTDFIHNTLKKLPLDPLAGFKTKNNKDMSLKASLLATIGVAYSPSLSDSSADSDFVIHIQNLVDKANLVPGLEKNITEAETAKRKAEKDLADYKAAENVKRIEATTKAGMDAGKITAAVAKDLADKYADDPEGLHKLVDGLPAYKTAAQRIAEGAEDVKNLADKSWGELDKAGKLDDLKAKDPELFRAKFKSQFGTDYKG